MGKIVRKDYLLTAVERRKTVAILQGVRRFIAMTTQRRTA